jgi:nitric oxide reductase NorD protein
LEKFPSLHCRYQRLATAFVASRPAIDSLLPLEKEMEQAIVNAILKLGSVIEFPRVNFAPKPVYLWLYPSSSANDLIMPEYQAIDEEKETENQENKAIKKAETSRKKSERTDSSDEKQGMMIFRLESLFSWSEFSKLDRGCDDSDDDEDNSKIVDDLDKIFLAKKKNDRKVLK